MAFLAFTMVWSPAQQAQEETAMPAASDSKEKDGPEADLFPNKPKPAPVAPVTEAAGESKEAEVIRGERSIYVPYEDLEKVFEKDGRGVFLPYKEFLDLWNQLNLKKDEDKEKPPADAVLSSAEYSARVIGDEDQVLEIQATLQVESFKEKGWAVVPLIQSGLNIARAVTGEATIHLGKNGYELILPKKGPYTIELTLYAKVERGSGEHKVGLNLPKAGVSRFEATLPEQGWDFEIKPGAAYSTEDLPDGSTRLAFFFGETEHFDVVWQKQGEETKLTPLLFVETGLTTKVIPGALQSSVSLNYRILRAGVDAFVINVPKGHEILGVTGANIKEWDVKEQGDAQDLTVSLHSPAKQEYALEISLEKALDVLPAEFDVPQVAAAGVVRQRGSVTLENSGELDIETVSSEGLTQQSVASAQPPNGDGAESALTTFGRFRFLAMPFSMTLSVKKAEPTVEVESWTRFVVEPDSSRFVTRFDYTIKRVGIFDTRIQIPGGFEGIEATGPDVEDFAEETGADGTRTLVVKFRSRATGRVSFTATGRRMRGAPEEEATVPVFAPQDVERHEGKVGLQIHTSLDPNTRDAGDLRQQDVSLLAVGGGFQGGNGGIVNVNGGNLQVQAQQQVQAPPATGIPEAGALQIGFRYRGEAKPALIAFKLKEPQVNAEVFALVDVREQLVRYRWTIAYNVLYAGVDTFVFSLPEDIAGDLRVDGQIIKEIDKEYAPEGEGAPRAGEGRKLWAVVLRDKRMGGYELELSYDRPLAEVEDTGAEAEAEAEPAPAPEGRNFAIGLPEIRLEQVFRETGQVAVVKDDNLEILDAAATALEGIDPKELGGGLSREGVFLAYKYRRHPLALELKVSRNEFLPVPQAVVTYAAQTTVVSGDKGITTEMVYWVKNNARQFFSVELPEGGKMVSDVYVDGEPQQPMRRAEEDVVLIRLPVGGEQTGKAFPVRFVFEVPSADPGEKLGGFGSIRVQPAVLTDAEVLESHAMLYLPQDYVYRSFTSAMRLPVQRRGWTRFRNAFDWLIPALGPQIQPGLEERWAQPPALPAGSQSGFDIQIPKEGQKFELHRLDAPAPIRVGFRSQGFAFFWEAIFCLAAFAGGVWLWRQPARWRFLYFVGAGLGSLIIAGAVSPAAASFWQAIYLGVLFAVAVWIVLALLGRVKGVAGWCHNWVEKWRARKEESQKKKSEAESDESSPKDEQE